MNKTILAALLKHIDQIREDVEVVKNRPSKLGPKGNPGRDFDYEENKDKIELALNKVFSNNKDFLKLKFSDLTPEEISKLKLNFSDLTSDEILLLKGKKGDAGKNGVSFNFDNEKENINSLITGYIETIKSGFKLKFEDLNNEDKESLKLKFKDLNDDDISRLRGPRGFKGQKGPIGNPGKNGLDGINGQDGKDFKFEYFTEDQLLKLKGRPGSRGQKGKPGKDFQFEDFTPEQIKIITGPKGDKGETVIGPRGDRGIQGRQGRDGRDGFDAPQIMNVEVVNYNDKEFRLDFYFDDMTVIRSNWFTIPTIREFITGVMRGGSSYPHDLNILSDTEILTGGSYYQFNDSGYTCFLPPNPQPGRRLHVSNFSNGFCTVNGNGKLILGETSEKIFKNEAFFLLYDNVEWKLI